jgi:hypothetical protein
VTDIDRRLLLAYGIASYATAVDHLEAVEAVGPDEATRLNARDAVGTCYDELLMLTTQWDPKPVSQSHVVAEARAYVTQHQEELDAFLGERGLA